MATIKLCDWTKKRLAPNEQTYTLILNGNEYEISLEAVQEIHGRLVEDEAPLTRQVATKPLRIAQVQQPIPEADDSLGLNVEAPSPFGGKVEPGLVDNVPQQSIAPIVIPASTKERLPTPTTAQAEAVVAESKRFPTGTLSTLTPGRQRNVAAQKLAAKESQIETKFKTDKERLQ